MRLELSILVDALQGHSASLQPAQTRAHKLLSFPDKFIRQILAGMDLRSRARLKQHATKFVECLPDAVKPSLDAWVSQTFGGRSSLQNGHLFMDLALLLFHRSVLDSVGGQIYVFAWGDSSKKGQLDMYNTRHRWMAVDRSVELARGFRWLCNHQHSDDSELPEEEQEERCRLSQLLFDSVQLHTQIPQLLGQGRTKLLDKVGAHVHSTLLEVGSVERLSSAMENCVSWCSDMGTEAGLPECGVTFAEDVLPSFVRPTRLQADVETEDGCVEFALQGAGFVQTPVAKPLMPNAIHVPGMCHAIHNASQNLDSSFCEWEPFFASLRTLHKFLGTKGRRDRFVEVVLENSLHYQSGKTLFQSFSHTLHVERWGEVAVYLRDGLPILTFLREHWDEVAYCRGMEDAVSPAQEDGFTPQAITSILRDDFFFAYWQMQLLLRKQIRKLLRWSEGCPCHESLLKDASPHVQSTRLRAEISIPKSVPCHCPMAGCRAAEMTAGHLTVFEEQLRRPCFNDLISSSGVSLTVGAWDRLRDEWQRGALYVVENLKLRLSFYNNLPWVILGGCHFDADVARGALKRAKELWLDVPSKARALQHPQAQKLLQDGPLRLELDSFLDGKQLHELPALEAFLAPLTFIQIAERIIEGAHKQLGDATSQKSPNQYSIALRIPELMSLLDRDATAFGRLVECFSEGRKVQRFPAMFAGHGRHPDWLALGPHPKTHSCLAAIRKILYRDTRLQHGNVPEAVLVQQQANKSKEKAAREFQEKKPGASEALIFADACTQFLRDKCSEDQSQVVSLKDKFLMPLLLRPSGIHRPSHAPGAAKPPRKNDVIVCILANSGSFEAPVVSAMPDSATETLHLLDHIATQGIDSFLEDFKLWEKPNSVLLGLPCSTAENLQPVSQLLTFLTDLSCFASTNAAVKSKSARISTDLSHIVPLLADQGYIEENDSGWFITKEGVASMSFLHMLSNPKALPAIVDKPLGDLSLCELLVKARQTGWVWKKFPTNKKARADLRYKLGEPRVWYSTGVTVHRHYLLCLLGAQKLFSDYAIEWIPHSAPQQVFEFLWEGKSLKEALELADRPRKRKPPALPDLAVDVDVGDHEPAAVCDAQPKASRQKVDSPAAAVADESGDSDKSDGFSDELLDILAQMSNDEGERVESQRVEVPGRADVPEDLVPATVAEPSSSSRVIVRHLDKPPPWGSFIFNRKLPKSSPPHGGLECVCRYHAKNEKTGCKKFVRFAGEGLEHEHACLLALKHWANMAKNFDRQRKHVRMPLRPSDVPSAEIVNAQQILDDPPEVAPTDDQLDARSSASSPKGKAKPKAKNTSKAKAKAKPKAGAGSANAPSDKGHFEARDRSRSLRDACANEVQSPEPAEHPCDEPAQKFRRLSTHVHERADDSSGVQAALGTVDWLDQVKELPDVMVAKLGATSALDSHLSSEVTIWVTSSYSGLGTFEHCVSRLASLKTPDLFQLDSDSLCFEPFRFYSATEDDPFCREVLLTSKVCPEHVFGDVCERVSADVLNKMIFTVDTLKSRAEAIAKGDQSNAEKKRLKDQLNDRCMKKLIEIAHNAMQDPAAAKKQGWCYKHMQYCSLAPPMKRGDWLLEAGGNTCVSFSPQGGHARWLHPSGPPAAIWLAWCKAHADAIFQECSSLFNSQAVLELAFPPIELWSTTVLQLGAKDVGVPMNRLRNWTWTVRRSKLKMVTAVDRSFFLNLCGSNVECTSHDFFMMPKDDAFDFLKETVGVPSPHEFGARQFLTEGSIKRLEEYEAHQLAGGECDEPMVDLSQNVVVREKLSNFAPSLLCQSVIWSFRHQRPITLAEGFLLMGWPVQLTCVPGNVGDAFPWNPSTLFAKKPRALMKMLGNSFHCRLVGLLLALFLSVTIRRQAPKFGEGV
ncbi:Uncharacterized protein SCF082_LOCUS51195 [Durusdinium trenchii]|uniref:Uncharacterized protein n=1 Tax=Durusdinium trenchii TaxID=1381693 RepID=A0ABP0SCZ4_9DINO